MAEISIPGYAVIVSPPSEPVGTPITSATTITESGDYYVANNFTATGSAIIIEASNVTIDLNWKTVSFGSANASGVCGIYSSSSFVQRDNIIIKRGNIKHVGTGLSCRGIIPFGTNWEVFHLAMDSNAGLFIGIGNEENKYAVKSMHIHHNYIQSRADYSSGYAADVGIALEERSAAAYIEINDNIIAEANQGVSLVHWGLDALPTQQSLIYENKIQVNRHRYSKSPYACAFGKSSNIKVYYNRMSAYNGRGVIADGFGAGITEGSTFVTVSNNAIGANVRIADKTYNPGGVQEYNNNYGIRCRYGSHDFTCDNNNIMVSNQMATEDGFCASVGEDFIADAVNTYNTVFDTNTLIANDGNTAALFAAYQWGAIDNVTITDTGWQQLADGVYERFGWYNEDPGNEDGDHRISVTETGTYAYSPTPTTPAAPTNLRLTKYFNSYIIEWDENTEQDVWQYKIYKNGVAIPNPIYSSRSPHINVPDPFYVDIEETGSVSYTVTALTLTGTESAESLPILTSAAANGWQ